MHNRKSQAGLHWEVLTNSLRNLRMRLCVRMYRVLPDSGSMTGSRWILFWIKDVTASNRLYNRRRRSMSKLKKTLRCLLYPLSSTKGVSKALVGMGSRHERGTKICRIPRPVLESERSSDLMQVEEVSGICSNLYSTILQDSRKNFQHIDRNPPPSDIYLDHQWHRDLLL